MTPWSTRGAVCCSASRRTALWGGFPLYWPLLEPAGALEILAHRVFWSGLTMGALLVVMTGSSSRGSVVQVRAARGRGGKAWQRHVDRLERIDVRAWAAEAPTN